MSQIEIVNVTKEDLQTMIAEAVDTAIAQRLHHFEPLLDAIVLQQNDACKVASISDDTIRKRAVNGDIEILGREGSRKNYVTVRTVGELSMRTKPRKVRHRA